MKHTCEECGEEVPRRRGTPKSALSDDTAERLRTVRKIDRAFPAMPSTRVMVLSIVFAVACCVSCGFGFTNGVPELFKYMARPFALFCAAGSILSFMYWAELEDREERARKAAQDKNS